MCIFLYIDFIFSKRCDKIVNKKYSKFIKNQNYDSVIEVLCWNISIWYTVFT